MPSLVSAERAERRLLPILEALQRLSISRATFYGLVDSGAIKLTRIGRRTFVDSRELERYMDSLLAA